MGVKSLPMGPSSPPEPAQGTLAPTGASPAHMGARVGWRAYKYGAMVRCAMGCFFRTQIRFDQSTGIRCEDTAVVSSTSSTRSISPSY
jgi:hypothetical protein